MRPVPWVVRRETEHPFLVDMRAGVMEGYDASGDAIKVLHIEGAWRDAHGWLWQPTITDQSGEPEWTQLHPERQRRCMDEGLCQVCGAQRDDLLWVLAPHDVYTNSRGELTGLTYTPPVCTSCETVARGLCPHLRRSPDWHTYTADRVLWAGVLGDVYDEHGQRLGEGWIKRYTSQANMTLARQRIVRLYGLKEVSDGCEPEC